MGEKSNFTVMVGDGQDGHTFTMTGLRNIPEVTPDIKVNTEEDLNRIRTREQFSKRTKWLLCKAHFGLAFYYLKLIVKSVFSKED